MFPDVLSTCENGSKPRVGRNSGVWFSEEFCWSGSFSSYFLPSQTQRKSLSGDFKVLLLGHVPLSTQGADSCGPHILFSDLGIFLLHHR